LLKLNGSGRATPGCTITAVVSDILSSSSANNVFFSHARTAQNLDFSLFSSFVCISTLWRKFDAATMCYLCITLLIFGTVPRREDRDSPTRVRTRRLYCLSFFLAARCPSLHARGDCPLDAVRVANLNYTIIPHSS